jgi:predicted metal-dependent hydrolase
VQLDLPFLRGPRAAPAPDPPPLDRSTIDFVRVRRASRYILRVRPDGRLRVTIPRGGSRAEGLRFATEQVRWIEAERRRVRAAHGPRAWTSGTTILLRGKPVELVVRGERGDCRVAYAGRSITIPPDTEDVRPFVEQDLRELARRDLVPRIRALAAEHGLTIGRVTIRNQRSRWGSCSRDGDIALNFRLVQMPVEVCDYVLLHELMHRREQNHSRRFWRHVERACPGFREAERWLRSCGRALL